MEGYEGHFSELGGYPVGYETYTADSDPSALFKGLPDDHCQCAQWGVVLKGKLMYRYSDGTEETIGEGEAYCADPGTFRSCMRELRSLSSAQPTTCSRRWKSST
jgi:hypothetical protein